MSVPRSRLRHTDWSDFSQSVPLHRDIERRITSIISRGFLLALALSISACASTRPPTNDTDLRLQAANHFFGGRYEYLVIHSAGEFADSLHIQSTQFSGPSTMARDLSRQLAQAQDSKLRIMVSGADSGKTLAVIQGAFALNSGRQLPGLEFLFLGEPKDEAAVRDMVEAVGGVMRFAPFEG